MEIEKVRGVIVLVKDFADGVFCEMAYLLEMQKGRDEHQRQFSFRKGYDSPDCIHRVPEVISLSQWCCEWHPWHTSDLKGEKGELETGGMNN